MAGSDAAAAEWGVAGSGTVGRWAAPVDQARAVTEGPSVRYLYVANGALMSWMAASSPARSRLGQESQSAQPPASVEM